MENNQPGEEKKCKILILVISSRKQPYKMLEKKGVRETWGKNVNENVRIIYLHGDEIKKPVLNGDELIVPAPEGITNIGYKMIQAFKYCLEHFNFTHIYRTNLSSYVHIPGLVKYATTTGFKNVYSGVINTFENKIKFISGSGYLLSKDIVEKVINNNEKWEHELIDDVALGKLLVHYLQIAPMQCERLDILTKESLEYLTIELARKHFHFRCKGPIDEREHDIMVMKKLDEIFGTNDR